MKKIISALAVLPVIGFAGQAFAADASGDIDVFVTVEPFIELTADQDLYVTVTDADGEDLKGQDGTRAQFTVKSNLEYTITATVPKVFLDPELAGTSYENYKQVSFTAGDNEMGGSIFIDTDISSPQSGNVGIATWDGNAGNIVTLPQSAGEKTFELGGEFRPDITPVAGEFAAPGTYTTNVTLVATTLL